MSIGELPIGASAIGASEEQLETEPSSEFCVFEDAGRQFNWDVIVGESILYNFRVESEIQNFNGLQPDSDQGDCRLNIFGVEPDACEIAVINVIATDIADVCQQLNNRNFDFVIKNIKRWSRPFDRDQRALLEAQGFDFTYNFLNEVPFDETECFQFSITESFDFVEQLTIADTGGLVFSYPPPEEGGGLFILSEGDDCIEVTPESTLGIGAGVAFSYTSQDVEIIIDSETVVDSNFDLGTLTTTADAAAELTFKAVKFGETEGEPLLSSEESLIAVDCECNPLPSFLEVHYNLIRDGNPLENFLKRNTLEIPSVSILSFNRGFWRTTQSYTGLSNNGEKTENWNVVFEWACTDKQGAFDLEGSYFWHFSIFIRQQLADGTDDHSHISVNFSPEGVCLTNLESSINFLFNIDTSNSAVQFINNTSALVNSIFIKDGIGLFKTKGWNSSPNLEINITQLNLESDLPRLGIDPLFPEAEQTPLIAQDRTGVLTEVI